MDRIQGQYVVVDTEGNNTFGCGDSNAVPPVPPTPTTVTWGNGMQEEIMGIIEELGLTPDIADNKQAVKAIRQAYDDGRYATPVLAHMLGDTINPNFSIVNYLGQTSVAVASGTSQSVDTKLFGWSIATGSVQHNTTAMVFYQNAAGEILIKGATSAPAQTFTLKSLMNRSFGSDWYGKSLNEKAKVQNRTFMIKAGFCNDMDNPVTANPNNYNIESNAYGGSHTKTVLNGTAAVSNECTVACSKYVCSDFGSNITTTPITPIDIDFTVADAGEFQIRVTYADFIPVLADPEFVPDSFPLIILDQMKAPVEPTTELVDRGIVRDFGHNAEDYSGINNSKLKLLINLATIDIRKEHFKVQDPQISDIYVGRTILKHKVSTAPRELTVASSDSATEPHWTILSVTSSVNQSYYRDLVVELQCDTGAVGPYDAALFAEFGWNFRT